jgi:hypothetical protein
MLESENDVKGDNFQKCFNSTPKLVVELLNLTLLGTTKKKWYFNSGVIQ